MLIRVDNSSLTQLAGKVGRGKAVTQALKAHAPAIKSAAQSLLKGGFWTEADGGIEILVTALDL